MKCYPSLRKGIASPTARSNKTIGGVFEDGEHAVFVVSRVTSPRAVP
jgi:hypothetical protein